MRDGYIMGKFTNSREETKQEISNKQKKFSSGAVYV